MSSPVKRNTIQFVSGEDDDKKLMYQSSGLNVEANESDPVAGNYVGAFPSSSEADVKRIDKAHRFLSIQDILFSDSIGGNKSRDVSPHTCKSQCSVKTEDFRIEGDSRQPRHTELTNEQSCFSSEDKSGDTVQLADEENIDVCELSESSIQETHTYLENSVISKIANDETGASSIGFKEHIRGLAWWNSSLWQRICSNNLATPPGALDFSKLLLPPCWLVPSPAVRIGLRAEESSRRHSSDSEHTEDMSDDQETLAEDDPRHATSIAPADAKKTSVKMRARRQRQAYTISQLNTLEEEFKNNRYLSSDKRETLSQSLGLSENQVKAWFQNRRTKHKKLANQQNSHAKANQSESGETSAPFSDSSNFVFSRGTPSLPYMAPLELHSLFSRGFSQTPPYLNYM